MLIPTDFLAAAIIFAAERDYRPALNGVFLDPKGYVAATDGHRAFFGEAMNPDRVELIIPLDIVKQAVKAAPAGSMIAYEDHESVHRLIAGDTELAFEPVEAQYPEWRRVVPERGAFYEQTAAEFDPKILADVSRAAKILSGDRRSYHLFQTRGEPCGVVFGARTDCAAVVMPWAHKEPRTWLGRPD